MSTPNGVAPDGPGSLPGDTLDAPDDQAQAPAATPPPPSRRRPEFTMSEAAKVCAVHRSTIRRYVEAGKFPNAHKVTTPDGVEVWKVGLEDLIAAGLKPNAPRTPDARVSDAHARALDAPTERDARARIHDLELDLERERGRRMAAEQLAAERADRVADLQRGQETLSAALRVLEPAPAPAVPPVVAEPGSGAPAAPGERDAHAYDPAPGERARRRRWWDPRV